MSETGTVLYIDDEKQVPAGFEEELRAAGYRLLHTADPDEALMLVRVEEVDVVLMEVELSTCYGIALLEEIRSYGGWPAEVPIIVLTKAERTPDLYGDVLGLGVQEFITKPALKAKLLECVRQLAGKVCEPSDVDPSDPSSAPESEAAISGDLAQTPISEVLRGLQRDAASGVLTVTHRMDRKAFELRNGSLLLASISGGVEAPEEFLARHGRISQKQLRVVKERVGTGESNSSEILVELGALSEVEFDAVIREQAEELLLLTFRWTSGAYHYFPDKHVRADVAFEIDRGHAALMLAGARHWSPQQVVAEELRTRASLYVSKVEEPPCELEDLDLPSAERVFYGALYGDRSVQEVIDSGDLEPRTLYGLFAAGLLVLHDKPVLLDAVNAVEHPPEPKQQELPDEQLKELPEQKFHELLYEDLEPAPVVELPQHELAEIPVEDLEETPEEEPLEQEFISELFGGALEDAPVEEPLLDLKPDSTEHVQDAIARAPVAPEFVPEPSQVPPADSLTRAEPTLAEFTAFCEQIREDDDFDVLGITGDVSDAEVVRAHERLIESLPSEAASTQLPELKDLAEEARKRIDKAFDRLRLCSSRKVYAQLRPDASNARTAKTDSTPEQQKGPNFEELASRGLDAEAWFRKGDPFFKAGHYEQAIEAYGMAAHLDPKEGEYLARLGYAQFLNDPKDAVVLREALENISTGIKLCPNREKPYIYLGKIFQQNGAVDRARKMFKNAVKINPNSHEAQQAVHLLDLSAADDGGKLINRLKGIFN